MIILDGKKLSEKILEGVKQEVAVLGEKLRLAVVMVGENPVVQKFIAQKKKAAGSVGIDVRIYPFDEKITTSELRKKLAEIVHPIRGPRPRRGRRVARLASNGVNEKRNTGVIIQLPLPSQVNTQYILNSVTSEKDVDVLSARAIGNFVTGKSPILPPVAGAIKTFFEEYEIDYKSKYTVVVGAGNLVGKPAALWLLNEKATFGVIRSTTENPQEFLQKADIIISGIGQPKFITGEMVKEGAVVIDAGTSESEGKVVGDVDFDSVAPKASYITPVPGGVGPVTVAMLLKNLVILSGRAA